MTGVKRDGTAYIYIYERDYIARQTTKFDSFGKVKDLAADGALFGIN
jgi:hypothetical protein